MGLFIRINNKRIVLASFGGRNYDDSPQSIYLELLSREQFKDYEFIWCFVDPDKFEIPVGKKVRIDSLKFFVTLLSSKIWISNSGMDRDIGIKKKKTISVETWHGTPLKKICGEENENTIKVKHAKLSKDSNVIRCAQSDYDLQIFKRVFKCDESCFIVSDLPRNDLLAKGISKKEIEAIKKELSINLDKKIILYMPTYREYLLDSNLNLFIDIPINFELWEQKLGDKYIVLFRGHYAINKYKIPVNSKFLIDVTNYPSLNNLYLISDMMISDYSSSFFDYSILERPVFCFAYDEEEYAKKRGLYMDLSELPCNICKNENELLDDISNCDYAKQSIKVKEFHKKYAPYAGNASEKVVDEIIRKINL